ncbi:LexA family protein [Pseudoalteromonas sp. H105]|uniref:LexA family protein n=1 Tax=Pseudoalteromonas sp. H105 TaxID=1348393 RepID=UPI0007322933|nr:S24 family peptidase [Pseudoalteromonas sp. H105]KTF14803.1 DNA polymerase V [Pseudoalteromonas sp. H105]
MQLSNVEIGPKISELAGTLNQNLLSNSTFIGRASGRSMEGVGIFDGDLLIIDRAEKLKHGDVIVAVFNGLFICKIADLNNNQLLSANPDNPPLKLTEFDEYSVEGVVSQSIRMHRTTSALDGV